MLRTLSLTAALFFVSTSALFAQDSIYAKRSYTTTSIGDTTPPKIDGLLDDPAWDLVEWTTDYVEFQPDVGTPPSEQTKMKIVYDQKNLYVAFRCYQEDPSTIERRMGRRDDVPGDWVEINLDSFGDDRTGFSFTISASGVKGDEFISENGNFDDSWNPDLVYRCQCRRRRLDSRD